MRTRIARKIARATGAGEGWRYTLAQRARACARLGRLRFLMETLWTGMGLRGVSYRRSLADWERSDWSLSRELIERELASPPRWARWVDPLDEVTAQIAREAEREAEAIRATTRRVPLAGGAFSLLARITDVCDSEAVAWRVTEIAAKHPTLRPALEAIYGEPSAAEVTVEAAAILQDGKVYSLPPPARHWHVMQFMVTEQYIPRVYGDQGFLLSDGRFCRRKPAEHVARESGQLKGDLIGSVLTTEDLW